MEGRWRMACTESLPVLPRPSSFKRLTQGRQALHSDLLISIVREITDDLPTRSP